MVCHFFVGNSMSGGTVPYKATQFMGMFPYIGLKNMVYIGILYVSPIFWFMSWSLVFSLVDFPLRSGSSGGAVVWKSSPPGCQHCGDEEPDHLRLF